LKYTDCKEKKQL